MSKSAATVKILSDEGLFRLIELVEQNPILHDTSHPFAKDLSHKNSLWESIAKELNTPVNVVEKHWNKLSSGYIKKCRDAAAGKITTVKNDDLFDEALAFLSKSSKLQRAKSCGEIPSIIEDENSMGGSSSEHSSAAASEGMKSLILGEAATGLKKAPSGSTLQKAASSEASICSTRVLRPRRSEPVHRSAEGHLVASSKRSTAGGGGGGGKGQISFAPSSVGRKRSKGCGCVNSNFASYHDDAATVTFFESMALTVALFPQHLQASVKMRICNVVAETEYELSSPKTA